MKPYPNNFTTCKCLTTSESLLWLSWDSTCLLRLPWLWRVIKRLSGSAYHRIFAAFRVNASPDRCILGNSQKDQASWRQAEPTGSAWLAAFPQNTGGSLSSEWFPGQTLLDWLWYIVQKPRPYWAVGLCYLRGIVYGLWFVHPVSSRHLSNGCCSAPGNPQALKHPLSNRSRTSPGSCNLRCLASGKASEHLITFYATESHKS